MKVNLDGIMPAMLTPFTRGGERVDYDKACAVAETLADRGVQGLYVAGTTGEGLLMDLDERKKLLEEVIRAVGKKLNVVAQVGCLDTRSTIELARHACAAGAKAVGVVAPGFYAYDDESLKRHYVTVANAVKGCPVLLYDIPSCARNNLSPEFVLELAHSVENIVGMKESHKDIVNFARIAAGMPKGFALINGADEYTYQAYLTGATGSVSSTANVVPEYFRGIYDNIRRGDIKKAWAFQLKLSAACALFQYGKMIAYYKEGMCLRGCDAGHVRPPQRELTAKEKRAFAKAMEKAGII